MCTEAAVQGRGERANCDLLGPYELGRVHRADCRQSLAALPDASVQCCVTSPPYWGLREYDVPDLVWGGDPECEHEWSANGEKVEHERRAHSGSVLFDERGTQGAVAAAGGSRSLGSTCHLCGAWRGQLGLEPTPDLYVDHLVSIFREVRRVLRDDGTLWLNIGDCYAASATSNHGRGKATPATNGRGEPQKGCGWENPPRSAPADGLKPKDLVGIPWLLAFALRADGWFLRAEIIWHKTAPMPESVRDRPTRAHEQIFLLSKSRTYFYNEEEATEPSIRDARGNAERKYGVDVGAPSDNGKHQGRSVPRRGEVRNWRTVWTIGPETNNAQHYAPFPREVARRCIVAGSRPGDVVLDPFAGTGTTVRVADGLGRRALGFDLGEKYVAQANERIGQVRPSEAKAGQQVGLLAEVQAGGERR